MVQSTLGERLQQARNQKSMSVADVAEKISISKEILEKFESNDFSIPLPKIYVRGFFRSYVKFLELNEEAFLVEYETLTGGTKAKSFPSLGHLQFESSEETVQDNPELSEQKQEAPKVPKISFDFHKIFQDKRFRYGCIALVCLFFLCCCSGKKNKKVENPTSTSVVNEVEILPALDRESSATLTKPEATPSSLEPFLPQSLDASSQLNGFTLVASDTVTVFVRTEAGKKTIFSGTLQKGERKTIEQEEGLQLSFSKGDALVIEQADGTSLRPQITGRGWIRIPWKSPTH